MSAIRDYHAAFDFGRLGLGAVSGANAAVFSGTVSGNAGFASGVYTHGYRRYDDGAIGVESFPNAVEPLIAGLNVSYDWTTMRYTLSAAGNFAVAWTGALGAEMAAILGFSANLSAASSYTSVRRPKYLIRAFHQGQSLVKAPYTPRGRMSYAESASGRPYSTGPLTRPKYSEWTQPMEEQSGPTDAEWTADKGVAGAPVRISDVGSATLVTWSWEDFFAHCSSVLPFALLLDADSGVTPLQYAWRMTNALESFAPDRPIQDWSALESFAFACVLIDTPVEV